MLKERRMFKRYMSLTDMERAIMRWKRVIYLPLALPVLAGCALTPEAKRPETISAIERLERYTSSETSTDALQANEWWHSFGDAEINGLVKELRSESLSLKETRLRIEQTRELAIQAGASRLPTLNGSTDVSLNGSETANGSFNINDAYGLGLSLIHI